MLKKNSEGMIYFFHENRSTAKRNILKQNQNVHSFLV